MPNDDEEFNIYQVFEGLNRKQAEALRARIPETIQQLRRQIEEHGTAGDDESETDQTQKKDVKMSDDVLANLSDDERNELQTLISGTLDGFKQKRRQSAQDELLQAYEAEAGKIQATGTNRVKKLAELKKRYRQKGLNIW